jgi:hypothetical protein
MFFGQNIHDTRALFYSSWSKFLNKQPLSSLEQQLAQVILDHPEYHPVFNQQQPEHAPDYFPELGETNPFLHLGLHLAIREQTQTDRPPGIASIFKKLTIQQQDPLAAEHILMECLAEALWMSQKNQCAPDEMAYLKACEQCLLDGAL